MTIETLLGLVLLAVCVRPAVAALVEGCRDTARDVSSMRRYRRAWRALDR